MVHHKNMKSMKKVILSITLCCVLTAAAQATTPLSDANMPAPAARSTYVWDPKVAARNHVENKSNPFINMTYCVQEDIFQLLVNAGEFEALKALALTSTQMARHITQYFALRAAFKRALTDHPDVEMLEHWHDMLFKPDVKMKHLIWAGQMLRPANIERLWRQERLIKQLNAMPDKTKALCLAANAAEIFSQIMSFYEQSWIIKAVQNSSRSLSDISQISKSCLNLFTPEMAAWDQAFIIMAAFED